MGIHKMVVDNYLVCYVIDPEVLTVTNVLYGASDIHNRLKEDLEYDQMTLKENVDPFMGEPVKLNHLF